MVRMTRLQALCETAGQQFRRFCANDSGATAIEYAMIAVGIAVVLAAAVSSIGSSVKGSFTSASNGLN
jgi:pilus assembly protein Flp/PilA